MPKKIVQDITRKQGDGETVKRPLGRKWEYDPRKSEIVTPGAEAKVGSNTEAGVGFASRQEKERSTDVPDDERADASFVDATDDDTEPSKPAISAAGPYYHRPATAAYGFGSDSGRSEGGASSVSRNTILWVSVIMVAAIGYFLVSSIFATALIRITPMRSMNEMPPTEFSVGKDGAGGKHAFQFVVDEIMDVQNVASTKEETVSRSASGKIVVYNKYSKSPQILRATTRFETPDGKIFRVKPQISVPGYTEKDGAIVPGSIEIEVTADKPGDGYNIGLSDFTVPGLKDSPDMFAGIYARSKTDMTGGFVGVMRSASDEDVARAAKELETRLGSKVDERIGSMVTEEQILFGDGKFTRFTYTTSNAADSDQVAVSGKLTVYAVVFNKRELSTYIAEKTLSSYDGAPVVVRNLDSLQFSVLNKDKFDPTQNTELTFTLAGTPDIVWFIDDVKIASDIAGVPASEVMEVVKDKNYTGVMKVSPEIRPFWKRTLPSDPAKITIELVEE